MAISVDGLNRRRFLSAACGVGLAAAAESSHLLSVRTGSLLLEFRVDPAGLTLARIANQRTGVEYLSAPSPLFDVQLPTTGVSFESGRGVRIAGSHGGSGSTVEVSGVAAAMALAFTVRAEGLPGESAALIRISLTNRGRVPMSVRATAPFIKGLTTSGRLRPMMAAVPQEAGGVISFDKPLKQSGMSVNESVGLPTAMNTMELVSLYDPDGHGGLFFADADADLDIGSAPVQFTFSGPEVRGHALLELQPGQTKDLPSFTIGVHDTGDWHSAVDHYCRRHRAHWHFPEIPAWFRDQGALYSFSGSGGGAIYMEYPQQDLARRIPGFDKLYVLLDEAQQLGTNIVYLWDFWEGTPGGGRPAYWNKGDYVPRRDLGGPQAFKDGIREVHERGGRVLLYLEPFIVFWYSQIGKEKGAAWAGRDAAGSPYHQYPQNYSMPSMFQPWQTYFVEKAKSLVQEFGADGIYLDSWGWQMNWPMKVGTDGKLCTPLEYSLGVLDLAKQVREAIRSVRPDAIVMGETTSGAMSRYWDGGLSADFAWLAPQNQGRLIGSPVRYGMPEVNIYSNGRNLNELNQVFAAGHNLALLNANLPDAAYIRKLVQIRQKYKDALIHGRQTSQPATGRQSVPAYYYEGALNHVVTAVNTASAAYSDDIIVGQAGGRASQWRNLLTGGLLTASDGKLRADLAGESLLVLALLNLNSSES